VSRIASDLRRAVRLHGRAWRDLTVGLLWVCCLVVLWFPAVARLSAAVRRGAERQRSLARQYAGRTVVGGYDTELDTASAGYAAAAVATGQFLADPANRRDLRWHLINPVVGGGLSLFPLVLLTGAVWGWLQPFLFPVWGDTVDHPWVLGFPVHDETTAVLGAIWCLIVVMITSRYSHKIMDWHGAWVAASLPASREHALRRRVADLAQSRRAVLLLEAYELKRIERDLHDGPQAKLIGIGMNLGAAEAVIESDPEQARLLITTAKAHIADALEEIRALVRGIQPPVLTDRGLSDAVAAVVRESVIDAALEIELAAPVQSPLDTALYFAVNECLANAAKHSGATHIAVRLYDSGSDIAVDVTDDGRGGARSRPGGGLDGMRQRLSAFDGSLDVTSPPGGPTRIRITVPRPEPLIT
jgi:signal transduction histidine kinase